MIPVPIIDQLVARRRGDAVQLGVHFDVPSLVRSFPMHLDYRAVDSDPTNLEPVEGL